jgi:putative transposase
MAIFKVEDDFRFYFECLRSATVRFDCQVHSYVFMTNHVHILMTPADGTAMALAMRSLGRRYACYFNRRYTRTGSLFEGRYKATVVDTEKYFFICHRYIEENPVRAGMTTEPSAYRWSSYRSNALGAEDSLLTPHQLFVSLGRTPDDCQSAYRALFRGVIDPDALMSIRFATQVGERLIGTGSRAT